MEREALKLEIESWINNYFHEKGSYNKKVYEAMFYSLDVGGKRIRPILMLMTYSLYKKDYKEIIPLACAIEMIHTYSLIHDDLPCMDNDDLRRGKPTNHKVFGDGIAVLAGDGLLNEAMNILFDFCRGKSQKAIEACTLISKAAGPEGMIGGQIVDILSEGRDIALEELNYMHSKKTGELIKAPILAAAVMGDAPECDYKLLSEFGEKLGLVFQIKDDILDVVGSTEILGKMINSDENNCKTTYVTIYGVEKCKEMCIELSEDCIKLLEKLSVGAEALKEVTTFLLKREF